jgi:hypothetical protein
MSDTSGCSALKEKATGLRPAAKFVSAGERPSRTTIGRRLTEFGSNLKQKRIRAAGLLNDRRAELTGTNLARFQI